MGRIINTNIDESLIDPYQLLAKLIKDQPAVVFIKMPGDKTLYGIGTRHEQMTFGWSENSNKMIIGSSLSPPMMKSRDDPQLAYPAKLDFDLISVAEDLSVCVTNAIKWFTLPLEERRPFLYQ